MKKEKRIKSNIKKYAIPAEEVFKKYREDPEHRRQIDAQIKYYKTLMALRATRKARGFTQDEPAKKSGVPRETISKIETGRRNVTLETIMALASAMGKRLEIRLV